MALVPYEAPRETLLARIRKALPSPRTAMVRAPNTILDENPGALALVNQNVPITWQSNAATYRALAATPWVHMAIDIRKDQIATADWDIVQVDPSGPKHVGLQRRIKDLFENPNAIDESFHSFIQRLCNDLLILDAAAFEIVRYPTGEIAELSPTRGEWVGVNRLWDGSNPDEPRYFWMPGGIIKAKLRNDEMGYLMDNPRTDSAVGLSPIEVLIGTVESELQAMAYNKRQVTGAAPDGIFNIGESAQPGDVAKAKGEWQQRLAEGGAIQIIGGYKAPSWMPFRSTNRDMQFREWQDLLIRCIAGVYGLSPMALQITFDVNRATAESQGQNDEDRGYRPLMDSFQQFLTRKVVWDRSFGGRSNNLAFKFTALNIRETEQQANINKVSMPGVPSKSVNDARQAIGRPPIGDLDDEENIFNHLLTNTPKGMLDLTTGKYIGEEQLASLQQETAIASADAKAQNADAGLAEGSDE